MILCSTCGKENPDSSGFCASCGSKLSNASVPPASSAVPSMTDPSRLVGLTVSLIPERSLDIQGYAQWLDSDIKAMSHNQLLDMLLRIRDARIKSKTIADKADAALEKVKKLQNDYETASKKKNYGTLAIPVVLTILSFLMSTSESFFLRILGFLFLIVFVLTFIIMLKQMISAGKWAKDAIKTYHEAYPTAKKEADFYVNEWYELYQNYNHLYVSAYKALPSYHYNLEALDCMIACLQNHRASTLQEAINLYEEAKQNQELKRMLIEQIYASESAAAAADRAAVAASNTAEAARKIAYDPYRRNP